jgi:hypothetical protein
VTPYAQLTDNLITVGNMADGNQTLLHTVLKHMILAAHGLDVLVQRSPEGTDVSGYVNTIEWLRHRIHHLAPPPPPNYGPTAGADVFDFATRKKRSTV